MGNFERSTAVKTRIFDLVNGQWVEDKAGNFVKTGKGNELKRVRILATVVSKFVSEDGNYGSLSLDDSTDTIRVKCFQDLNPISGIEVGFLVDLIGKARMYNEEIYIIPEVVKKIDDPNLELLRRLELLKKYGKFSSSAQVGSQSAGSGSTTSPAKTAASQEAPEKPEENKDKLREEVLKIIEASQDGIEYIKILDQLKAGKEQVEAVIDDLLSNGICYEPTPGKVKKI